MSNREQVINDLRSVVGSHNIPKISICGITPYDMGEAELVHLVKLTKAIQKRRTKKQLNIDHNILNTLKDILGNQMNEVSICGIVPQRMDKEELMELEHLVRVMTLRQKGYKVMLDRFQLDGETIKVTFDYHPYLVEKMGAIPTATFQKPKKYWDVHISQWPAVEELFRVTQPNIEIAHHQWKEANKTNRLRLTNKGCYLTGLDLPIKEIHAVTSFPDPNAQHMASFQNGSWDGRVALYERGTGFLPYGLLGKVLKVLKQLNITYEFVDERSRPTKKHQFKKNVKLRDYQENTLSKAMEHGRGILQLATGAGKTKTASAIVSEYGLNTIFFVHTKFLLGQAKEALEEVLGIDVGQVGDGIVNIKPVTVAMVQTTIRALGGEYQPSVDDNEGDSSSYDDETDIRGKEEEIVAMLNRSELVFFDECQFVAADTFYTIANYCSAYYKFGLSATPYRSDKKDLMIEAALGPVIDRINASYLIRRGFLTRPKIHFFNVGHLKGGDERNYQQVYREEIVENTNRNTLIVQSTKRLNSKNKSVLILVQQVNHGKILQEMFRQQGMDVEFVYGDDNLAKRDLEVYKLRTKKKLALIATTIADEGLDVPSLDAVILGGGGKSPSKGMQRVGRAIRIFGDNEESFEIFMSTKQLTKENKNVLIVVDSIEKGEKVREFFLSENKDRKKEPFEIEFLHGEGFRKNKKDILNHLANKDMLALIVHAEDITEEEVLEIEPLNALLISGGEKFNAQKIPRTLENVVSDKVDIHKEPVAGDPKKSKEIVDATNIANNIVQSLTEQKTTLILVDETKYGKAIKDALKERNLPVQYLTGEKQAEKIKEKVQDLINRKQHALIVNAQYINEALDLHLIDKVIVCNGEKPAYNSIEQVQRDIRIFTKKDEAFVIDFIDNVRYCYNHSLERRMMFETEEEFVISGWK